jgi:E3 ubiquitin-protein ligase EL5
VAVEVSWVEEEERMAADDPPAAPPAVPRPEDDSESPNFPTNVLFFGSQDKVSTDRVTQSQSPSLETMTASSQSQEEDEAADEAARVLGLRRLLRCGRHTPLLEVHYVGGCRGDVG